MLQIAFTIQKQIITQEAGGAKLVLLLIFMFLVALLLVLFLRWLHFIQYNIIFEKSETHKTKQYSTKKYFSGM